MFRNGVSVFAPIYWYFIYLPLIGLSILVAVGTFKVKAELAMCRTYYQEMSTWDCYWAPKFLPQRSSQ